MYWNVAISYLLLTASYCKVSEKMYVYQFSSIFETRCSLYSDISVRTVMYSYIVYDFHFVTELARPPFTFLLHTRCLPACLFFYLFSLLSDYSLPFYVRCVVPHHEQNIQAINNKSALIPPTGRNRFIAFYWNLT